MVTIEPVDTRAKAQVRRFVELPYRLYAGTPQWVPPLAGEARSLLDRRRHPFYRHSEATFYLAERGTNPKIKTLVDALYYISTCLSVGYADIFAQTQTGRAIATLVMTVSGETSGGRSVATTSGQYRSTSGIASQTSVRSTRSAAVDFLFFWVWMSHTSVGWPSLTP